MKLCPHDLSYADRNESAGQADVEGICVHGHIMKRYGKYV